MPPAKSCYPGLLLFEDSIVYFFAKKRHESYRPSCWLRVFADRKTALAFCKALLRARSHDETNKNYSSAAASVSTVPCRVEGKHINFFMLESLCLFEFDVT